MEWISEVLGLGLADGGGNLGDLIGAVANIIVVVVTPLAMRIAARYVRGRKIREVVFDAAAAAVSETYETFVREAKARAADGKLSAVDRREAMRIAVERLKQIARARGVDVAKEYGDDIARAIVQQLVAAAKARAARPRTA